MSKVKQCVNIPSCELCESTQERPQEYCYLKILRKKSGIDYLAESATAGFKEGAEGLWNAGVDFVAASQRRGTEQAIEDLEGYADMDAVKKLVDETVIKVNKNAVSARIDESSKIEKELADNYYASGAYKIAGDVSNGVGGLLPTLAANSIIPGAGMPV
ncbi:MAG: hypothetical protein RR829_05935, partial [Oscillospiraceae bacterium]